MTHKVHLLHPPRQTIYEVTALQIQNWTKKYEFVSLTPFLGLIFAFLHHQLVIRTTYGLQIIYFALPYLTSHLGNIFVKLPLLKSITGLKIEHFVFVSPFGPKFSPFAPLRGPNTLIWLTKYISLHCFIVPAFEVIHL